jgi:hypothetical protein
MRTEEGYWAAPWTTEEVDYLRDNYGKIPVKGIAAHLGRSYNAVVLRARIEGFKSRHRSGVSSLKPEYFRIIDTPMKAYLLGLYTADGGVSKAGQVTLALADKDRALVEAVRDELAPGARLTGYTTKTTTMVRFSVSDPGLVADLASHGVVNNKTLITTWPEQVPEELEGAYVCGYYDGDGSLSTTREGYPRWAIVSGCRPFLEAMQDHIEARTGVRVGGPYRDTRHEHAWSIVQVGDPAWVLDAWMHALVPGLGRKRLI